MLAKIPILQAPMAGAPLRGAFEKGRAIECSPLWSVEAAALALEEKAGEMVRGLQGEARDRVKAQAENPAWSRNLCSLALRPR